MAEQKTVTLAEGKIKGAGDYVTLLSLQIDTESNQHGSMTVTLQLETDEMNPKEKDWTGEQIQAETRDGTLLFTGECIHYLENKMVAYREVTLYVASDSYQTDITGNSRTFQKSTKTMGEVAKAILEPYGAICTIEGDKTIPEVLTQYKETDWKFLVRVANQYGYQVYTNPASNVLQIALGSTGEANGGLGSNALLLSETINLQEMRLKVANQGEEAGTYRYKSEDILSYNPSGQAGSTVGDKLITSSHIKSEKGV